MRFKELVVTGPHEHKFTACYIIAVIIIIIIIIIKIIKITIIKIIMIIKVIIIVIIIRIVIIIITTIIIITMNPSKKLVQLRESIRNFEGNETERLYIGANKLANVKQDVMKKNN